MIWPRAISSKRAMPTSYGTLRVGQLLLGLADDRDLGDRVDAVREEVRAGSRMARRTRGSRQPALLHRGRGERGEADHVAGRVDVGTAVWKHSLTVDLPPVVGRQPGGRQIEQVRVRLAARPCRAARRRGSPCRSRGWRPRVSSRRYRPRATFSPRRNIAPRWRMKYYGNNDPDILNFVFHSMMFPPNGANRGRYANAEVDRLIDLARRDVDTAKRKAAYQSIQRIVAKDLPYVSLVLCGQRGGVQQADQWNETISCGEYEFLADISIRN